MRESASEVRQRLRHAAGASWTARDWARAAAIAAAAGAFLGVSGAFGTGAAPLPLRLAYWIGLLLAGTGVARVVFGVLDRVAVLEDRAAAQLVAGTLTMACVYTPIVWGMSAQMLGHRALSGPAEYFPPVLLVSAAMTALNVMAARRPRETHAGAPGGPPARFLERLPPKLRGAELQAVEAEDHYLRLHTDRGSDLILMRLADAVAELEGVEGAQTHRSWWVAKQAVTSARREGPRAILTLKCGVEAPVSRTYVQALKAEGWF